MDIGIGLDATLNLSWADQAALSQEAARLGYTSIWTPESTGQDAFPGTRNGISPLKGA